MTQNLVVLDSPWFHGSPAQISVLRQGSTITQDRHLAQIFSHKPTIASVEDDGSIRHNGVLPGFLYLIVEPVSLEDIVPVPRSSMEAGKEWLTLRELCLHVLETTEVLPDEFLSEGEIEALLRRAGK